MVTEKLNEYITTKGISLYAFENSIGASRGSISKAIKENKSIGSHVLENILNVYSDLNPEWLLTGHGSMLRSGQHQELIQPTPTAQLDSSSGEATAYYKMYKEKDAEVGILKEKMGALKLKISQLESQDKEPDHHPTISEELEAFTSDLSGDSIKDSSPTKPPTTSKRSSAGKM